AYAPVAFRKLLVSCVVQPGLRCQSVSSKHDDDDETSSGHSTMTTWMTFGAAFHMHSWNAANWNPYTAHCVAISYGHDCPTPGPSMKSRTTPCWSRATNACALVFAT